MNTCKLCEHWRQNTSGKFPDPFDSHYGIKFGECESEKILYNKYNQPVSSDMLVYWDAESYAAGLRTGEDFGCIHFKGK